MTRGYRLTKLERAAERERHRRMAEPPPLSEAQQLAELEGIMDRYDALPEDVRERGRALAEAGTLPEDVTTLPYFDRVAAMGYLLTLGAERAAADADHDADPCDDGPPASQVPR
jgi:hypothetical protein